MILSGSADRSRARRSAGSQLGRFGRLRRLDRGDWRMLFTSLALVLVVRVALWAINSTRVHALLIARPRGRGSLTEVEAERWSLAVSRAARLVPRATCLTQALALQAILRRRGEASSVDVGFLRDLEGQVKGHAWLVWQGRVIIGGKSAAEFTRLFSLEG